VLLFTLVFAIFVAYSSFNFLVLIARRVDF
jgi:hypothetical protein